MTDILIRNVPQETVDAIDAQAKRMGLSRTEYLRRALERERRLVGGEVTQDDWDRFTTRFADLADPEIMKGAWG